MNKYEKFWFFDTKTTEKTFCIISLLEEVDWNGGDSLHGVPIVVDLSDVLNKTLNKPFGMHTHSDTIAIDKTWWRHQKETLPALLVLCVGNSPVNSPHKGQWRGALMFSLISAWTNGWVNHRDAGDTRRHLAHYDVTVMNTDSQR